MVKVMEQNNGDHQDDDVDTCNEKDLDDNHNVS